MKQIDYDAPATLYVRHRTDIPGDTRTDVRDFNSVAEAIKHAMEELAHVATAVRPLCRLLGRLARTWRRGRTSSSRIASLTKTRRTLPTLRRS